MIYFSDKSGKTAILGDTAAHYGVVSAPPDSAKNFSCDGRDILTIRPDGSLLMGFKNGQHMATPPGSFTPGPIQVLKMCVFVFGTYPLLVKEMRFVSPIFQWPAAPGQRQWMEGEMAFDSDESKWIPRGTHLGGAWALHRLKFHGPLDAEQPDPADLRCNR